MATDIPAIVLVRLETALQWARGSRRHHPTAFSRCSRRPSSMIAECKPRRRMGDVRGGEAADRSGRSQQPQGIHGARPASTTSQARRQRNRGRIATQERQSILAEVGRRAQRRQRQSSRVPLADAGGSLLTQGIARRSCCPND